MELGIFKEKNIEWVIKTVLLLCAKSVMFVKNTFSNNTHAETNSCPGWDF